MIVLDELVREAPFTINQEASDNTQVWTICKQVVRELELMEKYDFVITDRSVMDAYCYGDALENKQKDDTYSYLQDFLKAHIERYYHKLYLLDMHSFNYNVEDGVRDTDSTFRQRVYESMAKVFKDSLLDYTLIRNEQEVYSDFI